MFFIINVCHFIYRVNNKPEQNLSNTCDDHTIIKLVVCPKYQIYYYK